MGKRSFLLQPAYLLAVALLLLGCSRPTPNGLSRRESRQYKEAVREASNLIELDPQNATAYHNRGIAYAGLQDCQRAIADYDKAIELDPELATVYYDRGNAYYGLRDYQQAIADFDQAIELEPRYATTYYNRGLAHRQLGRAWEAIADLERFLELSNDPYGRQEAEKQLQELRGE